MAFPARSLCLLLGPWFLVAPALALDRPDKTFQVFQFPASQMPRIDGDATDWALVPEAYHVTTQELQDAAQKHAHADPRNLDVRVRVGWVKGLNRLYFLYEAYDDFWHFGTSGLHNDTFEVMVDGDASGGPFGDPRNPRQWTAESVGERRAQFDPRLSPDEWKWAVHGVHAQNYHIFTPAGDKDWALAWGAATWIKAFPFANAACSYDFRPGESGRLVLEFWITPFDHAGPEGSERAVESLLVENKLIGLGWIVIDYDSATHSRNNGFWTLSRHRNAFADATDLPGFRLMPLEPNVRAPLEARWSFHVTDHARRQVVFRDESLGPVQHWRWDFGDGSTSHEQHPIHHYTKAGDYIVTLQVEGPNGSARHTKVWDVQFR